MAKSESGGEAAKPAKEREVRIYSLATTAKECILFLEELTGNRLLPIWIGLAEGQAIAIPYSGVNLPRPLTHDLLWAAIKTLGYGVKKIVVSDIKENTFYAEIHISKNGSPHVLDARPSDAIALAVRAQCPLFVHERVFASCQTLAKPITEDEVSKFKSELKSLKPEDIFKDLKGGKKGPQAKEPEKPAEKNTPEENEEEDDDE